MRIYIRVQLANIIAIERDHDHKENKEDRAQKKTMRKVRSVNRATMESKENKNITYRPHSGINNTSKLQRLYSTGYGLSLHLFTRQMTQLLTMEETRRKGETMIYI